MRIDKLLWQLRFVKTRGIAQALVARGHIRRNGQRVQRASADVEPGDTLTLPLPGGVQVVAIDTLPTRRGPATEAQSCYRVLDPTQQSGIARKTVTLPERGQHP
ncbi:RNA-binding S4 domain-containing protein [Tsuneonella mangrovi]|uniref:RNA-binding S4 domain-containing protein n=1 Tax=Tsuneonella mangrovi TaxID=1982042 RepID=UPI000BA2B35C|nr:RNA-binding S4 domain-containing protein [Tsuneonella mangrovi]